MRILFTNHALLQLGGTESYVRDVASALLARDHQVAVYSPNQGPAATELRRRGVTVVDRLGDLPWDPQIIHGHHHLEAMTAVLHFGATPAIYVCHGFMPWQETPPVHPRILRHVAVDSRTMRRAIAKNGVPTDRIFLMPNFVDTALFRPRPSLPSRPLKALLFSPHATPDFLLPQIRIGCERRGVQLDAVGVGVETDRPQELLLGYDLVFAKGRSALEAMACGAAVAVCGVRGIGPLVDMANFERLRRGNFASRKVLRKLTPRAVARVIDTYDPDEATRVQHRVRDDASLDRAVPELLALYRDVIDEFDHSTVIPEDADAAAAAYLAKLGDFMTAELAPDAQGSSPARQRRPRRRSPG